jgi:hypothetical protein
LPAQSISKPAARSLVEATADEALATIGLLLSKMESMRSLLQTALRGVGSQSFSSAWRSVTPNIRDTRTAWFCGLDSKDESGSRTYWPTRRLVRSSGIFEILDSGNIYGVEFPEISADKPHGGLEPSYLTMQ